MLLDKNIKNVKINVCKKCIYDERVPAITFNDQGVCNYCLQVEKLIKEYGTGQKKGYEELRKIVKKIKLDGKNKKYDCVIGVSGGTDSSYLIHLAKNDWKLNPLAVHYDDTWNTATASMNMKKVLEACEVDLY
ncbi:MAG: hypothetical protein P8M34_10425, partial [Saprospiraceae bacterium]|nr:hypothetical protein [Saprospiraceae bacterium]